MSLFTSIPPYKHRTLGILRMLIASFYCSNRSECGLDALVDRVHTNVVT